MPDRLKEKPVAPTTKKSLGFIEKALEHLTIVDNLDKPQTSEYCPLSDNQCKVNDPEPCKLGPPDPEEERRKRKLKKKKKDELPKEYLVVLGGFYSQNEMSVIDKEKKTMTRVAKLKFIQENGCAAVLNRNILCFGGGTYPNATNQTYLVKTGINLEDRSLVQVTYASLWGMDECRLWAAAVVFDDTVYVTGGWNSEYSTLKSCEIFTMAYRYWRWAPPMLSGRSGHALVVIDDSTDEDEYHDGVIYCLGGYDGKRMLNSVERFHPVEQKWTRVPPMRTCRCDLAAVVYNNVVYAIGGDNGQKLNGVEKLEKGKWMKAKQMTHARSRHTAVVSRDLIYVLGGVSPDGSGPAKNVEVYDPDTDGWTVVMKADREYYYHSMVTIEMKTNYQVEAKLRKQLKTIYQFDCEDQALDNLWVENEEGASDDDSD